MGRPVVDGAHLEVVFAHPEGVLDLPQAAVLAQDGVRVGGLRQVGDDPVQAVPSVAPRFILSGLTLRVVSPSTCRVLLVAVVVEAGLWGFCS